MTYGQAGDVCPQCGSAAAVHSIAEWVAMTRGAMGGQPPPGYGPMPQPGYGPSPQQGYGPSPQPGYQAGPGPGPQNPQTGFPDPSQYQQSGFPDPSRYQQSGFPDPSQYQQPGSPGSSQDSPAPSAAEPTRNQPPAPPPSQGPPPSQQPGYPAAGPWPGQQAGYPAEPWQSQPPPRRSSSGAGSGTGSSSLEDAIAEVVLDTAVGFIGRAIGRRVRRTINERVLPTMAARQDEFIRQRTAIAERHPDLRACLNDHVVFLAGGTRVLPMASAMKVTTVDQADALVAQLRG